MNADSRLVCLEFVARQEAHVVGRDQCCRPFRNQREDACDVRFLVGTADALHLEVIAVAEQGLPGFEECPRLVVAARQQGPPDVALRPARQRDESRGRRGVEPLARQQRASSPLALEVAPRHQPGEIAKAREVLGEQRQQRGLRPLAAAVDPEIRADEGLHALLLRFAVELDHRKEVAVVSQRDGGHAGRGHGLHEPRHADDAVHERIFGVQPQVDESRAAGAGQGRGHTRNTTVSGARN